MTQDAIDLPGVRRGVLAGGGFAPRRPREGDEPVGAVAAPHLAGVGVFGRGPGQSEIHTFQAEPAPVETVELPVDRERCRGEPGREGVEDLVLPREVRGLRARVETRERHGDRDGQALIVADAHHLDVLARVREGDLELPRVQVSLGGKDELLGGAQRRVAGRAGCVVGGDLGLALRVDAAELLGAGCQRHARDEILPGSRAGQIRADPLVHRVANRLHDRKGASVEIP